jgi:hypothetical protein
MGLRYNPFNGSFDFTRSPGSYLDGEVQTFADLPLDTAAAPLNSAWLVREASGLYFLTRKPAGIYIRTATGGTDRNADFTYASAFPDVFSDANFTVYDDADSTRSMQIQVTDNETLTFKVTGSDSIVRSVAFPLSAILLAALMSASSALAQNIGIVTGTNGTVITGRTNTLTFTNPATFSGTLTATGNVTMSGTANTAPLQTASSGASLMTRDLLPAATGNEPSFGPTFSFSAATTNSATAGARLVAGVSAQTGSSTNGRSCAAIGESFWALSSFSGALMPANKAIDLYLHGVIFAVTTNTNWVSRIIFGQGSFGARIPPAAGANAVTNRSWGVEFYYDGTNQVFRPFWHDGTTLATAPPQTMPLSGSGSMAAVKLSQTGTGGISVTMATSTASRIPDSPTWSTNVASFNAGTYAGHTILIEAAGNTNQAQGGSGTGILSRAQYIRYVP